MTGMVVMKRTARKFRETRETRIEVIFGADGSGKSDISTGIGFFDHMLSGFARHGLFDLELNCSGDLVVDGHHTIEDCGIVLGEAIAEAVGDKKGIRRFGHFILPMDDALILCALDLSGRSYLNYEVAFTVEKCGQMETEMVREFFYAVSCSAGMNLHIRQLSGHNNHHIAEAIFKAFGKALDMACGYDERIEGVLSTKGSL